ncbi:MAG: hypothetical protein Q8J66_04535 [Methylotenera sp.]|nr:hypothetical protein [Methylotenera sp.]
MNENEWIVAIEKTSDNRYVMTFGGKVQLTVESAITWLFGLAAVIAGIQHYFIG